MASSRPISRCFDSAFLLFILLAYMGFGIEKKVAYNPTVSKRHFAPSTNNRLEAVKLGRVALLKYVVRLSGQFKMSCPKIMLQGKGIFLMKLRYKMQTSFVWICNLCVRWCVVNNVSVMRHTYLSLRAAILNRLDLWRLVLFGLCFVFPCMWSLCCGTVIYEFLLHSRNEQLKSSRD